MKKKFIALFYGSALLGIVFNACQSEQELNYSRYFINGREIYEQHCENCHGKQGQGLNELIPPLTDTTFLKSNKERLACFVKFGFSDSITVNRTVYQGKMPSEGHLTNIDIAQVITYVTNSFGNKQGLYEVKEAEKDLKNCK
jgi:mono/diheme cytochrome c family protein